MSEFLARIRRDIETRMVELEPMVREANCLEQKLAELDDHSAEESDGEGGPP